MIQVYLVLLKETNAIIFLTCNLITSHYLHLLTVFFSCQMSALKRNTVFDFKIFEIRTSYTVGVC